MSDNLARPKFPKFTKKRPAKSPSPAHSAAETVPSYPPTSPLTPLPASRPTSPGTHVAENGCSTKIHSVLRRTHFGKAPDVCGPWDGKVASRGTFSGFVITSPTQLYVPEMPKDVDIIHTFIDGRWGVHEYSRHPQFYVQDMAHIACIPRHPCPPTTHEVLFQTLRGEDHWQEDRSVAVRGLGRICSDIRRDLTAAANAVIDSTATLGNKDEKVTHYRSFLVMLLRQVLTRMNYLPVVASRAMAIAAHIQRLCLELAGLKTYLEVMIPRMKSSQDFSTSVLDVVGGFLREGAVTQTWHRVGIPYWVIQPLTENVVVYQVVPQAPLPIDLATARCDPPILHRAGSFVGVSNLTGTWVSRMILSMSKHVAGSHLSNLDLVLLPEIPVDTEPTGKRPRLEVRDLANQHLRMRAAQAEVGQSKAARRRKRRQAGDGSRQEQGAASSRDLLHDPTGAAHDTDATGFKHPSRIFFLSPFVDVLEPWAEAMSAVSPLPQTKNSALYFFPPPFLLDTVSAVSDIPPTCPHPDRARVDTKVNRYVHNLLRIREFCRLRLFDVSLNNRPLSVGEWRAALWGDYLPQTSVRSGGQGSEARRAERRLGERNVIGALFHKVAHMDAYNSGTSVSYEGEEIGLVQIATDVGLRQSILWESHEINFRAELLALDALLVQSKEWEEIHRWEREMLVSGVWGPPTCGATVVADTSKAARVFCWYAPPHGLWEPCRERLRHFALILTRWPDCPEIVIQAGRNVLDEEGFAEAQRQAVRFYVRMFVSSFARLPVPPIVSI